MPAKVCAHPPYKQKYLPNESTWSTRLVIPLILIIFAVVLSGVFLSPQAHAATVSTGTINSEDELSYEAGDNTLYFYDIAATGDNVAITTNSNFTLYPTSTATCDSYLTDALSYEVKTTNNIAVGESVSYGSSSNPCITIYVTNAGYAGDGTLFDVEYKFNTISIDNSLDVSTNSRICVLEFLEEGSIFSDGFWMTSYRAANIHMDVTVTLYKTGTNNILSGYSWLWKVVDIDQPGRTTETYTEEYAESIMFGSGFDNTVYTLANSYVSFADYTYNGQTYTRVIGSRGSSSNDLSTGFITEITSGQINFIWSGGICGTLLALNAAEHTTPAPVKEVDKSTAYLGDNITYTVTQTIPYMKYDTLTFTDVLDGAYNVSSATITIYRTYVDTTNGGTIRSNDTSNWTISTTTSTNTITASRHSYSSNSTGGDYEFIITVPLSTDADLSSHSSTTSNGTKMYIVPNTASVRLSDGTKSTNTVQTLIPLPAEVQYQLVGTNKPSDSTLPPGVTTYVGDLYTIEDGLTTSDTSAVWYFNGWYYDSALTEPASGTITLPEGVTVLYGQWLTSEITLEKTADVTIVENAVAGTSTITYMFTVTNTGNVSLNNITLTDPLLGGQIELEKTVLAPNDSTLGWATYTLTQSDIDAGIVTNVATVTGEDPGGSSVTDNDDEEVDVEQLPSIDLVKEVVGDAVIENAYAGDWVQFAVTITNTGNTSLYNATITDLLEGATFVVEELNGVTFNDDNSVVIDTLLPGDTVTVYVDYQLMQADIDRGDTENIATVIADPPKSWTKIYDDDDETIKTPSDPSISLTKTANVESIEFALPGDVIYYTLTITNTGNTTISNLTLDDKLLSGDITGSLDKTTIAPGESATALLSYTLTQDDIDTGSVYNFATATGDDPKSSTIKVNDDYTVELIANPSITLTKTVAPANNVANEDLSTGDELVYTLIIANNGNQTLTNITLYDELLGGEIDLTNAVKGIDMTVISYEAIDEDVDVVEDEAVEDDDDIDGVVDEGALTEEEATKTVEETVVADDITSISARAYYTEHTMVSEDDPITTLRPGEYLLVEITYTITQGDMDSGRVDNTATVSAEDPNGNDVADEDTAVMYLPQHPEITLVKEASFDSLAGASVGDAINYTLTVTNTGDVSLTSFVLTDELEGIVIDTSVLDGLMLAPGETVVVTAEYALTNADLEAGSVYNHATVTAESVVPYDEDNIWNGAQQVNDDDDALVDGIVAVADDLILAQTGGKTLIIFGCLLAGLIATASIAARYIGKQRRTNIK